MTQQDAQTWLAAARGDSDTIAMTLGDMEDGITAEGIRTVMEAMDSLRRNVLAMHASLVVDE